MIMEMEEEVVEEKEEEDKKEKEKIILIKFNIPYLAGGELI